MVYWLREALEFAHVPEKYIELAQLVFSIIVLLIPLPILFAFYRWSRPRQSIIPPYKERVLILGASSGVGREIALAYALRGCRSLALVGRREAELKKVEAECHKQKEKGEEWEQSQEAPGWEKQVNGKGKGGILALPGDCTNAKDLIRIREACREAFDGLDTIHICFGVSALRPLLGIAGVDPMRKVKRADLLSNLPAQTDEIEADISGLEVVHAANERINEINVTATSMVLTAFLPMLQLTSASPSINLLSSIAAYIPAPTRALYGSSKAAQLLLFQSVGIEADSQSKAECTPKRAKVRFHATLPATIFSDFRNSAVDGSVESSQAKDDTWQQGKKTDALTPEYVASKCIFAVDRLKEGVQEMPAKYWLARRVAPYFPSVLAKMAQKKYSY